MGDGAVGRSGGAMSLPNETRDASAYEGAVRPSPAAAGIDALREKKKIEGEKKIEKKRIS